MFFYPMVPQRLIRLPHDLEDWVWQPKIDGWHILAIDGRIYTRHGLDITDWPGLEEISNAIHKIPYPLDGELCGIPREKIPTLRRCKVPGTRFVVFDIPLPQPLRKRLDVLENLPLHEPLEPIPTHPAQSHHTILNALTVSIAAGAEGIVLKRLSAPYRLGIFQSVPSPDMLKLKP
jgi:bifunctional non-homologous end joining protein LigD